MIVSEKGIPVPAQQLWADNMQRTLHHDLVSKNCMLSIITFLASKRGIWICTQMLCVAPKSIAPQAATLAATAANCNPTLIYGSALITSDRRSFTYKLKRSTCMAASFKPCKSRSQQQGTFLNACVSCQTALPEKQSEVFWKVRRFYLRKKNINKKIHSTNPTTKGVDLGTWDVNIIKNKPSKRNVNENNDHCSTW